MNWNNLGDGQWEAISDNRKYEFVIESDHGKCILDIFDQSATDSDKAFIDSIDFDTIEEAKKETEGWI